MTDTEFTEDDLEAGEVHMANKILELNEEYKEFGLSDEARRRAIKVTHRKLKELHGVEE